jgi:hypothetical protein
VYTFENVVVKIVIDMIFELVYRQQPQVLPPRMRSHRQSITETSPLSDLSVSKLWPDVIAADLAEHVKRQKSMGVDRLVPNSSSEN